ncbi:response regulator transcription factor [Lacticaseibacillus pantheris]|uniref:response regulator transcription factor n=1 Tax=Lacticaseibacillus pantheris TaxID=171523 RepID=UPI00265A679B|nr:response regulator transcription factor [Lacticaseibacillus pantheris]WKF84891.1 response regulator transcription factor [Lacticaseibacillus pantheris]
MISVYLAEDQSMLNSALTKLLNLEDDLQVVGSALDGATALNDILRLKPNVAVLDIEMPQSTGLDVAAELNRVQPETKVIILTTFAQKAYFERAVAASVAGYLLKDSPSDQLVATIRDVVHGLTRFDPELVINMVSVAHNPLTAREQSVLVDSVAGGTTHDIATRMHLSDGTVRNYLSAIFSKLGVHSRLEAISVAQDNKWI